MSRCLFTGLTLALSAACVTTAPPPATTRLPDGVYHHDVAVFLDGKDPQRFAGILKIDHGHVGLVMLSAFGTTVARLSDDAETDNLHVEIYADDFKPYEERISVAFQALKPALIDPAITEVEAYGHALSVVHSGTAGAGVPKVTTISREGIRIVIEVTSIEKT